MKSMTDIDITRNFTDDIMKTVTYAFLVMAVTRKMTAHHIIFIRLILSNKKRRKHIWVQKL